MALSRYLSPAHALSQRLCGRRLLHAASVRRRDATTPWPQLKRRIRPEAETLLPEASITQTKQKTATVPDAAGEQTGDARRMLVVHGLSRNLSASDFYRLAPGDISSWQHVIKKVQQHRDPETLEPLGRYQVTFSTSTAALLYRDKLIRLHRLSAHKLRSASGLWESTAPEHLCAPGEDPARAIEALTLAPGSLPAVRVDRARVSLKFPWARRLGDAVERLGHGVKPPVVLLQSYPPGLEAADVARLIEEDGDARERRWDVCEPMGLEDLAEKKEKETIDDGPEPGAVRKAQKQPRRGRLEKLKSRFVVVCGTDLEARRFHRSWNARTVTVDSSPRAKRHVIRASMIEW